MNDDFDPASLEATPDIAVTCSDCGAESPGDDWVLEGGGLACPECGSEEFE